MKKLILFGMFLALPQFGAVHALTVEEIVRLKQAGVADSTIELLIARDAARARRTGIIRQDGWIVHTTDTRERTPVANEGYVTSYPVEIYPWAGWGGAPMRLGRGVPRPRR